MSGKGRRKKGMSIFLCLAMLLPMFFSTWFLAGCTGNDGEDSQGQDGNGEVVDTGNGETGEGFTPDYQGVYRLGGGPESFMDHGVFLSENSMDQRRGSGDIHEDSPVFSVEDVSIEVTPLFLEENLTVSITPMTAPAPVPGATVEAFSFTVDAMEDQELGYITLEIPFTIEGNREDYEVGAGYYHPYTQAWEPVIYEVDEDRSVVRIFTNHLSTYGSFVIQREGTRYARVLSGMFEGDDYIMRHGEVYGEVIKETMNNQMTPAGKAYDLGRGILGDWLDATGGIFTLEGVAYSSEYLNNLSDMLGTVGNSLALTRLAVDYSRGDDRALAINAIKSAGNYMISKWGTKMLKVSFIGVTAIDYSINQLAEQMIQGRQEIWQEAYKIYYRENHHRTGVDWFQRLLELQNASENPEQFQRLLETELNMYTWRFWDEPDSTVAFYQSEAQSGGFTGGGGLNEKLKKDIADAYKAQLMLETLEPVFRQLEKHLQREQYEEYLREIQLLRDEMNQMVRVDIVENYGSSGPQYANYIVELVGGNEDVDRQMWTGRLNDEGAARTRFTVLGHLSAGAPTSLALYESMKAYEEKDPVLVQPFTVEVPLTTIVLGEPMDQEDLSFNVTSLVNYCIGGYGGYCSKYDQPNLATGVLSARGVFTVKGADLDQVKVHANVGSSLSPIMDPKEGTIVVEIHAPADAVIYLDAQMGYSISPMSGSVPDEYDWRVEGEHITFAVQEVRRQTRNHVDFHGGYFSGDGEMLAMLRPEGRILSKREIDSTWGGGFGLHNGPQIYIVRVATP